jgi:hypothetical protein
MGNTRDTGYLRNLVAYDASGNIVLPANLTVTGSIVGYATTSYVTTQINNLINGAPGLLDTLDELAAALGDDANFASTITTSIAGKLSLTGGTITGAVTMNGNLNLSYSYPRINLIDTDNNSDYSIINADGNFTIYDSTNGADRLLITSGGDVGIGTAPGFPSKKLEISDNNNSTSTVTGLKIINYSLTANARSGIVFQSYDNNGAAIWSNRTGTTTGDLVFGTNAGAGTAETNISERMRIYSDGVVTTRTIQLNDPTYFASNYYGIRLVGVDNGSTGTNFQIQGRTTPTGGFSTLVTITNTGATTVVGNVYSSGNLASATGNQSANTTSATLFLGNRGYFSDQTIGAATIRAISTGTFWYSGTALSFSTNPGPDVTGTNAVERMRIFSDGNVFIGTSPSNSGYMLDVSGAIRSSDEIYLNNGKYLRLQRSSGGLYIQTLGIDSGTDNVRLLTTGDFNIVNGSITNLMTVKNGGNVGIGITSPTTRLDIGNGTLTAPTLRGRTYQLSNVSSQNPTFVNGTGFNSIPVRVGDIIDLPFSQTRTVTAVTDTQLTVDSAWTVSFAGSNVEGRGGIVFQTNNTERMHITSGGNILIPGNVQFASVLPTVFNISLAGMSAGSWFNLTTFNFNGFSGLATITIPNLDSNYGYITQSSAWIFQTGANQEPVYDGIRGVTIRPDGTSQEGYNVVESYHTAPVSGRVNMRMRLRPRDAGLGSANPINLQIWVDHTVGITAGTPTLSIKRV